MWVKVGVCEQMGLLIQTETEAHVDKCKTLEWTHGWTC